MRTGLKINVWQTCQTWPQSDSKAGTVSLWATQSIHTKNCKKIYKVALSTMYIKKDLLHLVVLKLQTCFANHSTVQPCLYFMRFWNADGADFSPFLVRNGVFLSAIVCISKTQYNNCSNWTTNWILWHTSKPLFRFQQEAVFITHYIIDVRERERVRDVTSLLLVTSTWVTIRCCAIFSLSLRNTSQLLKVHNNWMYDVGFFLLRFLHHMYLYFYSYIWHSFFVFMIVEMCRMNSVHTCIFFNLNYYVQN